MLVYLKNRFTQIIVRAATEVADQNFYLTQSQYAVTGPTSPSADPVAPGAWQDSHWSADFYYDSTWKKTQAGIEPGSAAPKGPDPFTTRPAMRFSAEESGVGCCELCDHSRHLHGSTTQQPESVRAHFMP